MFHENRKSINNFAATDVAPKFKAYHLGNFRSIPQIKHLTEEQLFDIEVVGNVLPFKVNTYVVNELINWNNVPADPIFILTFPQKDMLEPHNFDKMAKALKSGASREEIKRIANEIRQDLNPHPAGQMDYNVPIMNNIKLDGMQHKYNETVLFFPKQGQTCHAYCTFCFRWPQFTGTGEQFAAKDIQTVIDYVESHTEVTDILFTGGDPMIMSGKVFADYINAIIAANIPNLKTIRIGTKSLAYWPYRFTTDPDSKLILRAFENIILSGKQVAIMAHFNHPNEMKTAAVRDAIRKIRETGAQIRTQSPIFRALNDSSEVWSEMWTEQVRLGCIPYYMFMARDTGAQEYFKISLVDAWNIFRNAYNNVSGLGRTVRGPVMSCGPGKVQMLGVSEINGEKVMVLRFIQGRNNDWVHRPFFAKYDENAYWIDDLKPAFGEEKFFFEDELEQIYADKKTAIEACEIEILA
ncbi:MAG: lysine 2,3-aminomutase [Chlorobi bacterium]|nr:lysine 2,3-aminomutase [Chlorobiota bacterium]